MIENHFNIAQHNMIEQQIRPWDVLDSRILKIMATFPREFFMPENYEQLAYADIAAPLSPSQTMLEPRVVGRILQSLNISPNDNILEIGTGSGYLTACLAKLGQSVSSWEIDEHIHQAAKQHMAKTDINNAHLFLGDGFDQLFNDIYDVIVITGEIKSIPDSLTSYLTRTGRLLAFVDHSPTCIDLLTRCGNAFSSEHLIESSTSKMIHNQVINSFSF